MQECKTVRRKIIHGEKIQKQGKAEFRTEQYNNRDLS